MAEEFLKISGATESCFPVDCYHRKTQLGRVGMALLRADLWHSSKSAGPGCLPSPGRRIADE